MKNACVILQITAIMLCCTFVAKAQKVKPFNGSITYSISYPDSKLDAAVLASQPTETKVIILGNKSKSEVVIQGMVFITQISNGDNKTSITMIDAGGQKIYYKLSEEEIKTQREEDGEAVTELLDETKVIAGITCKKANVKLKDSYGDNFNTTVYYAPEIGSKEINFEGNFKDIPGLPLYYELKQNEQLIVFEAKEIKKGKFKEIDFLIPSDFKELSPEEKQQLLDQFKGQGQ